MNILQLLLSMLPNFTGVSIAFMTALAGISLFLPADEQTIIYNALLQVKNDLAAGKPIGTALADAWNSFYQAEQGEIGKIGQYLLGAILAALAPKA